MQELRRRLRGVQGIDINTSSSGLADSVRQLKNIEVCQLFPSSPTSPDAFSLAKPASLRHFVQRAYTKSIAVIWILDTPLLGFCVILGELTQRTARAVIEPTAFSAIHEAIFVEA